MKCPVCDTKLNNFESIRRSGKKNALPCSQCGTYLYTSFWVDIINDFLAEISLIICLLSSFYFVYIFDSIYGGIIIALILSFIIFWVIQGAIAKLAKVHIREKSSGS